MHRYQSPVLVFFLFVTLLFAITQVRSDFDVSEYGQFLKSNEGLTADGLLAQYPAGLFLENAEADLAGALYGDLIDKHYRLTETEKDLLRKHGFVVTERLSYKSFGEALLDIYDKDLPVYVSSDAILHALHMSYDAILMDTEVSMLVPRLDELLSTLHRQLPGLAEMYASRPEIRLMLGDVDVYLAVAMRLLGKPTGTFYPESEKAVSELLSAIKAEEPVKYPLFSSEPRAIDFSQFTIRGHYANAPEWLLQGGPGLDQYFQAMIWLGRTEFYLTAPKAGDPQQRQKEEDIQRQTIDAVLLVEAAEAGNALDLVAEIDSTLRFLVGESDNVTADHIRMLMDETGVQNASELLEVQAWRDFQATLLEKEYASQRILSQILESPMDGGQIEPASAFLLLGQRFAIDSFITGNVVFDKIKGGVRRMLPSTLDVLFALGNDASIQLLKPELEKYHYSPNLASLRYLIDSYDQESWDSSMYNGWLDAIRALNPPEDRSVFPSFMQTAPWWQQKMNTQLAAWAQLRHDNLLYVKQSYAGCVAVCSYPESFVEPIPEFYSAVKRFADNGVKHFERANFRDAGTRSRIVGYFTNMSQIVGTLETISQKRLDRIPLLDEEKDFLRKMWSLRGGSGPAYDGWYTGLFYSVDGSEIYMKPDMVVADIHTAPTDEAGNMVGWIMHAGTGPINMAIMVSEIDGGRPVAFIGPVMSYYKRVTTGFKRLTDEEWETEYARPPSYRPAFVNLYLADKAGMPRTHAGERLSLFTMAGEPFKEPVSVQPDDKVVTTFGKIKQTELLQNYPNPFNPETWIPYRLASAADIAIRIYSVNGQLVRILNPGHQEAGLYISRNKAAFWDGKDSSGEKVSSGVYFYTLQADNFSATRKMAIAE